MHKLQTNPVREAILVQQETRQNQESLLVEEMSTLERFQPRDPSININRVTSFDYFVRKQYKPKENIEHVYQLTALAFIFSCDRRLVKPLLDSQYFVTPLLTDIIYCLNEVQRIDPDFLRLAFRFSKFTLSKRFEAFKVQRNQIQELIAKRAIENVDNLRLEDLAYISDVCRYQTSSKNLPNQYITAIKPLIMQSWETELFMQMDSPVLTATKLVIAVGSVHKYKD